MVIVARTPGPIEATAEERARRPDRFRRLHCAQNRAPQCDYQQAAARKFEIDRLRSTIVGSAELSGRPIEEIAAERAAGNPAGRFGRPEDFGEAYAFLCGVQAGYFNGQSLLIDGDGFPVML